MDIIWAFIVNLSLNSLPLWEEIVYRRIGFVHLTDGHDTLISNEMRRVSFDASDVLSTDGIILPLDFALGQNYQTFNPTTKIKYALAR